MRFTVGRVLLVAGALVRRLLLLVKNTVGCLVLSDVSLISGAEVEGYFVVQFHGLPREFTRTGAYPSPLSSRRYLALLYGAQLRDTSQTTFCGTPKRESLSLIDLFSWRSRPVGTHTRYGLGN